MDLRAQSALLAALTAAVLAVAVALRASERRQAVLFTILAGNLSLWLLCDFLALATGLEVFLRLVLATGVILPATGHLFFQAFLDSHAVSGDRGVRQLVSASRLSRVVWAGAVLGVLVAVTPLARERVALLIVVGYVVAALGLVLTHVFRRRDTTPSRIERVRLSYVAVGGGIALAFALVGFVPSLSGLIASIGNAGVALYLYFLSQAILRHRLLDLNELLGRMVVLTGLALALTVIYGAILVAVAPDPALLLFNVVLASFIILTLFPPLRSRLEKWVMAMIFAERYELTRALERLRRELPGLIDVGTCARRILDALYETNRVTHASVYLLAEDGTGYRRIAARGPEPPAWVDAPGVSEILDTAQAGQKAILRETVERRLQEAQVAQQRAALRAAETDDTESSVPERLARLTRLQAGLDRLKSGVTVPLLSGGRVVGLLNLRDERVFEAYSTDEIAAIIVVAELAARVVENSRLYEQMKERDRLAALGEMAAGLAHEIRNPLGAIKAAAQYLEPDGLPGDQGEFLTVIIEETDRLNGVVSQFLDYARPLKSNFAPTDLGDIVRRTLRLLERQEIPEGVEVVTDLAEDLPKVQGDAEQLKQVLINLMLNAVQAMEGKGRLEIRTRRAPGFEDDEGGREQVELRVRDSGPGIPDEVRESMFIPFFTTKDRGTGLGLPICHRIVQNHHGVLEVHSRPGDGAELVVRLPAAGALRAAAGGALTPLGKVVALRRP